MMDPMVLQVQEYLNSTYGNRAGYTPAPENGKTGWSTMYSLTRALQLELGITSTSDSFGPLTAAEYKRWGEMVLGRVPTDTKGQRIVRILQGACWCKGYSPGAFNGSFTELTRQAIINLQTDAGLPVRDGKVYDYIFKALLTMDAYRLTPGGDVKIQEMQRDLNYHYFTTSGVQPADGQYQRGTNRALIYGIQTEQGISSSQQTGSVGPTTRDRLPNLSIGDTGVFVKFLQYAMYVNNFDTGAFDSSFSSAVQTKVLEFQNFVGLTSDGLVGRQTWLSLLVSSGDPTRRGTASDCITEVTSARAQTLKNAGYQTIGRYLSNVPGGLNKKIQPGELDAIFDAGLTVFPIFQTQGSRVEDFSYAQGMSAAEEAYQAANSYGFKKDTIIYFAVDFDALGYQIIDNIMPHFEGINQKLKDLGAKYRVGVYGPRSVCISVSDNGLAVTSFVSGMSNGFSGNLGYPLPKNWAFDQISTISLGSGEGLIEIDNNIKSDRDNGQASVDKSDQIEPIDPNEDPLAYRALYNKFKEIGSKIPLLNESPINLFEIDFKFNQRYRVTAGPFYEVFVEAATTVVMPGLSEYSLINFKNGQANLNAEAILGENVTSLTVEQIEDYDNFLKDITLSADNGTLAASMVVNGNELTLDLKVFSEEIEVSLTRDKLLLEITITVVIKNDKVQPSPLPTTSPDPIFDPLTSIATGVVVIGTVALAVYFIPAAAGAGVLATAGAFISFLVNKTFPEEQNDES